MDETLKVTDKRMFTADGELREEHRGAENQEGVTEEAAPRVSPEAKEPAESSPPQPETPADAAGGSAGSATAETDRRAELPGAQSSEYPTPTFLDLVGLLAQPIAMFLGDAAMPGAEPEENLPLARFHIDLLELVEAKTKGNISAEEAKVLEELLYQLRMRYVEKVS